MSNLFTISRAKSWLLSATVLGLVSVSVVPSFALQRAEDGASVSPELVTPSLGTDLKNLFGEDFKGRWTISGEGTASQEYDDNAFPGVSSLRLSDNVTRFSSRFSLGIRKKRLTFQIHYLPQYALHAKYGAADSLSQQVSQELTYRWSAKTDIQWTATASRLGGGSGSPFLLVQSQDSAAQVFYPQALQQRTNITTANTDFKLSHRVSARSTLKADISGGFNRFTSANGVPLALNLGNEGFSTGANLGWDYEFAARKKVGVQLSDSYFAFMNPSLHSHYQAALLTYSQTIHGNFAINLSGGPSYRTDQASSLAPEARGVSYAANAAVTHTTRRTGIGIDFRRGSQTGTVQGSISTLSSSIFANRKLGRRWETSSSFSYSQMQSIGLLQNSESYSANSSAGYQLTSAMLLQLRYSYINQVGSLSAAQTFDRNIFAVAAIYRFGQRANQ